MPFLLVPNEGHRGRSECGRSNRRDPAPGSMAIFSRGESFVRNVIVALFTCFLRDFPFTGAQGGLENFCQMQRSPAGLLQHLFVTTETIGDDQRPAPGGASARQKNPFPAFDGDLVMFLFETERAGHAAATRIEMMGAHFHPAQKFLISVHFQD